ncbi:hypothetical protein D9M71_233360 [compost metagenome]
MCKVNGGATGLQVYDGQVQAAVVTIAVVASGRDVVGFHHLIALQGFQVDIEAPQTVQMFKNLLSGFSQGFAVMLLMAQGE